MEFLGRRETDSRAGLLITSGSLFVLCCYGAMSFSGANFSDPILAVSAIAVVACVLAGIGLYLRGTIAG